MIGHKDFTTRPATAGDITAFYGEPTTGTVRALVAEYQGEVVAVAGVVISQDGICGFSDVKDGIQYTARAALRFATEVVKTTIRSGHVRAMSRTANEKFLTRLGFRHVGASEGYEVYEWN